jgi:glycosyltransferase involved in cell wall biosynthesis
MRVLVAAQHLGPNGGTGAHVAACAAALERAGHDVVLAVGEHDPAVRLRSEVCVLDGLGAKETTETARDAFRREIRRVRPDVVHIQQLADGAVVPVAREAAPVVFDVHNFVVCTSGAKYFRRPGQTCHRAHGGGCIVNLLARGCAHTRDPRSLPRMYRRTSRTIAALRSADAVVGHSRYVLDQLRLNAIERTSFVPLFLSPQPEPSPVPASRRIVFSGRVTANKGVDTLVRAAARLDAELEVCGDGWWVPQGRKLADRLGVADRVEFRGWMTPTELSEAYRDATVVAVPSHWPEPFGLVGLEAMAHGRPVVGSDAGGIPEWLSDGESGLLVPAGDADALSRALAELLDDRDRCARMGAAGAARVESEFSERRYLTELGAAYEAASSHWHSAGRTR